MGNVQQNLRTILNSYGCGEPQRVESLGGAGGFSGAQFWRVSLAAGVFCIRQWPQGSDPARIRWIHDVVRAAAAAGCDWLAAPCETNARVTFVPLNQACYELAPWMPGKADFHEHPSTVRLQQAMRALAQFHQVARESMTNVSPTSDRPPAVQSRIQRIRQLRSGGAHEIAQRLGTGHPLVAPSLARRIVERFQTQSSEIERALASVPQGGPLVPCLRDIWHDHVLFTGEEVSGIVDYDALRLDNVATDISRLVGSLVRGDHARWQIALEAYHAVAPLDADQRHLCLLLDASNVMLAGMQWLEWLFVREIKFQTLGNVQRRLQEISLRLNEGDFQR
ncbi:MAG: phosphotransferase [Planctomycetota bacterium]